MNYQDLVDPNNPRSWNNVMPKPKSKRLPAAEFDLMDEDFDINRMKRFSMNFLDTIGDQVRIFEL